MSRRAGLSLILVWALLLMGARPAWPDQVRSLVEEVSQSSYTHYLRNVLHTRAGDDRGPKTEQHDRTRQRILGAFTGYGLKAGLHAFQWQGATYYNVAGVLEGKVRPDEYFVIGAHYDSKSTPGADDNASGVAAVLEAARVASLHDFESSIVFLAFDLEEVGLLGSKAWAADHAADRILGMVDLDMIAFNPPGTTHDLIAICLPNDSTNSTWTAFENAVRWHSGGLTPVFGGISTASDHMSFAALAPSIQVIEASVRSNTNYHKPTDSVDTPDYIDYAFAWRVTRSTVAYLGAQALALPETEGEMRLRAGGLLNSASFVTGVAAPSQLVTLKGSGFVQGPEAGTTVTIGDSLGVQRSATPIYVSPGQINLVMPESLAAGPATVTVARGDGAQRSAGFVVRPVAPGLFTADASGSGAAAAEAVRVAPNGAQTLQNLSECATATSGRALLIDFGGSDDRVVLVLYGTGIRGGSGTNGVRVTIGTQELTCQYAGRHRSYAGLDQINVELPRGFRGMGQVPLHLTVDGVAATPVTIDLGRN